MSDNDQHSKPRPAPAFEPVATPLETVELEHRILDFWKESRAFEKLRERNAGKPPWSFLDGPITANNPMGVHHAWGRTLKDVYQRFHAMRGHDLRYQNGFDCQGLWVEVEVEKELGFTSKKDIEELGLETFINKCKERVLRFSALQTDQSIRLGYWMDWDNSYFTMSDENNYTIWSFLKKCHQRGLIYKGLDAMPWCPRCGTGISDQEMAEGYKEIVDPAIFVRLRLRDTDSETPEYLLVWTTTPWTLPANVACAVHPDLHYIRVEQGGEIYYLSKDLESILKEKGPHKVLEELKGEALIGRSYDGPFDHYEAAQTPLNGDESADEESADDESGATVASEHRVIAWKEVAATEGTGIVHIAPGCGKEDFGLGNEEGLARLVPIDEAGHFVEGYGELSGRYASDIADDVIAELRSRGSYYKREAYTHRYPHCWRCKTKLLYRTVDAWHIDMQWRDEIKDVVRQIQWIPSYGRELELDWLTNMGDWMINKRRYWGLALPIWVCGDCGDFDVIGGREELEERATSGWEDFDGNTPHRPWIDAVKIACKSCGGEASRIPDVGNPWLDAGIVPYSTLGYNQDREEWRRWFPADLVLESFPGQFRNWFYALLTMSTMMEGERPFKALLGYALMRDEHGSEMHKSKGNSIRFEEAAEKVGVETMRWLFCHHNPIQNMNFGFNLARAVNRRVFNTWWNVYAFLVTYMRADAFDPGAPKVPFEERQDIDRWVLSKLQELVRTGEERLAAFDAAALSRRAEAFINELSTWYVRRCRRRFWRAKSADDRDKQAAFQTLYEVLVTFSRVVAPIVPFLTEEIHQNLVRGADPEAPESVHHCDYPTYDEALHDEALAREMDATLKIVSLALSARETRSLRVRQPLAELVVVPADDTHRHAVERFGDHIADELNVKALTLGDDAAKFLSVEVKPNFKLLGPKYGKDMRRVAAAVGAADSGEVAAAIARGEEVTVESDGDSFTLEPKEVLIERHATEGYAIAEDKGLVVALDAEVTPELEREGLSRDLVRHVQQLRKELDLEVTDRIRIAYASDAEKLLTAIDEHRERIASETLADELVSGDAEGGKELKILGSAVRLSVARI